MRDFLMRLPAVLTNGYFLVTETLKLQPLVGTHPFWGNDFAFLAAVLSRVGLIVMLTLLTLLHLIRRRPVLKHLAWRPKVDALVGAIFLYPLLLLPRAEASWFWDICAALFLLVGNTLCAMVLTDLGRSISVMPEARKLVTEGFYRWVRHPLYFSEAVAFIGVFLQFRSLLAFGIIAIGIYFQIRRMAWEENVLTSAFPEYADYAHRTSRFIPRIY